MPGEKNFRVGTINLQRVFDAYYKTPAYKRIVDDANKEVAREKENFRETIARAPHDERPALMKEHTERSETKRREIHETSTRLRREVLADIKRAVKDMAEKAGFDLIVDDSDGTTGIQEVLYARAEHDFSDEIIEVLNRGQPRA